MKNSPIYIYIIVAIGLTMLTVGYAFKDLKLIYLALIIGLVNILWQLLKLMNVSSRW